MTDQEHQAECLEIHNAAVAIRRMSQPLQVHAYETLARDKGPNTQTECEQQTDSHVSCWTKTG